MFIKSKATLLYTRTLQEICRKARNTFPTIQKHKSEVWAH